MAPHDIAAYEWPTGDFGVSPKLTMTEEEFIAWAAEDVRAEWVDGRVVMMSPANREHSKLNWWLLSLVGAFVEHFNRGEVLGPEYTVRLGNQRRRRVPDILFVAKDRLHLLTTNHVEGAPDLVMEIVSPDSDARDWRDKYLDYRAAGVREYWVIDPMSQHAEVYALESAGEYQSIEPRDGKIASTVLPNFWIKIEWLWPDTRPKVLDALRQLGVL